MPIKIEDGSVLSLSQLLSEDVQDASSGQTLYLSSAIISL